MYTFRLFASGAFLQKKEREMTLLDSNASMHRHCRQLSSFVTQARIKALTLAFDDDDEVRAGEDRSILYIVGFLTWGVKLPQGCRGKACCYPPPPPPLTNGTTKMNMQELSSCRWKRRRGRKEDGPQAELGGEGATFLIFFHPLWSQESKFPPSPPPTT